MHPPTHTPDKRTEKSDRMKRARPNRMKKAQVLPPHHVDLTLPNGVFQGVRVPAHVTGGDLSQGGPTPAANDDSTIAKPRR